MFDQRIVTKALRDIGPLAFLADGEPFAGCLFHEMVISDGRKMSKHLGNVVDPDALVERYGADTVRLAVLYAAAPAEDAELERLGGAALRTASSRRCGSTRRRGSRAAEQLAAGEQASIGEGADAEPVQRHQRAPAPETVTVV